MTSNPSGIDINANIFRAYDIRGVVTTDLRPDVVFLIGRALATLYPKCQQVVVGRDGRLSSQDLADQLIAGLRAGGTDVIDVGEVPTPILYYATHALKTGSGLIVTGSHNPPEYNGIKMVMAEKTLFGDLIQEIFNCIQANDFSTGNGTLEKIDIVDDYVSVISRDIKLQRPLKIAIDCGNGVAGPAALQLFAQLGCEITPLYCDVDGTFPNHHPNPSDPQNLIDLITSVKENKCDLGIAFDGDGDRCLIIDNKGEILWPDRQMMVYSKNILLKNKNKKIVFDVKSSKDLPIYISCLLYTSPSPRDVEESRMPSSA